MMLLYYKRKKVYGMYRKLKRTISGALCAVMLMGCMTGCSLGEKVTAESLMENAFPKDMSGLDADIDMSFACEMEMEDLGMSGTMEMALGLDSNLKATEEAGYMSGEMKIKMLGMSVDQPMETYFDYENGVSYNYDKTTDSWSSKKIDKSSGSGIQPLDVEDFDDLELKNTKSGYQVSAALDYDSLTDLMGSGIETTGDFADMGDFSDMEMTAVFDFAKDKSLSSIEITAEPGKMDQVDLSEFTLKITINEMGDSIEVSIPKDVVENALPEDDADAEDGLLGDLDLESGTENPELSVNDDQNMSQNTDASDDPGMQSDIQIEDSNVSDNTDTSQTTQQPAASTRPDEPYGTYNGTVFSQGLDVNTFLSDGWTCDDGDTGIFVAFENPKFDGVDLYLYSNKSEIGLDDLKANGVYGYSMDATFARSASVPNMSFAGLTWGASRDDVVAKYGTPANEYTDSSADAIHPYVLKYEMGDVDMTFSISQSGLSRVEVINYNVMD